MKDWEDIIAINLNGVFNVTHAFLGTLRATKGRIVNIGSIQSFMHVRTPSSPAYTASKHGVLGFTRALAAELGKDGVRVNAIGPGFIETPLNAEGARQQSGAGEDLHRPHPARPRRQARGHRRTRDLPRLGPVGLCHRLDRDGRRRLPDDLNAELCHVQRPAFRYRRAGLLGRSLSGSGADAASRRRSRSCRSSARPCSPGATTSSAQEKRIDVFSSHQPAGLMNTLMGHNMMRKDGEAHMTRARRDVSRGVAAHGARHLEHGHSRPMPTASSMSSRRRPRRPHARRSRCRCRPNA